jgi:mitochondrial splicing suppressor protein 51
MPSLQNLKFVLIDPKSVYCTDQTCNEINLVYCPTCITNGRKRAVVLFRGLYRNYIKESQYQKLDLTVLLRGGRSQAEGESWCPTTKFLIDAGILTVCKTYTHREAREEVAELDKLGARFRKQPEINK